MSNAEIARIEPFRYADAPRMEGQADADRSWVQAYTDGRSAASSTGTGLRGKRAEFSVQRYDYGASNYLAFEEDTGGEGSGSVADPVSQADTDADLVPLAENAMASEESMQRLLVLETAKAEERGRSKGFELGLASGREETLGQLQAERDRLHAQASALIESFAVARESYFHRLEQEGVQLALAIAARILRREAQMDPLLLTGAVRVALRQLADSTEVRLTVPLEDHALWEEALARMPGLVLRPQVLGDAHMQLGDCRMETELGSANLGLWAQLKEIERGFFVRAESSGQVSMEQRSGFSSYEPAPGEAEAADGAYGTAFSPARFASAGNAEERQNG